MKSSYLSVALGLIAVVTALAIKQIPRGDVPSDTPELDTLRDSGAI